MPLEYTLQYVCEYLSVVCFCRLKDFVTNVETITTQGKEKLQTKHEKQTRAEHSNKYI